MKRMALSVVFCALAAFFVTRVYWGKTFPYTHDGANHLARFANYAAALREGQFPPRFAPYIFSGFGFPVFHYNYPLANIFSVPFTVIGLNPEDTFAILATAAVTFGVLFTFLSLRRFFAYWPSVMGATFYLTSAYLLTNIYYRGGIGELMAYAVTPVCFYFLDHWHKGGGKKAWLLSILSLSALLLSHNVLSLMAVLLIGAWSGAQVLRSKKFNKWLGLWLGAIGLTLWFWLPAVAELNLVALSGGTLTQEAVGHVLEWQQLFSPWRFGFSRVGPLDSYGFGVGPAMLLLGFLLPAFLIHAMVGKKRLLNSAQTLLFTFFVASIFLALSPAKALWESLPGMNLFQFPWRWFFLATLAAVPLFTWVYQISPKFIRLMMVIAIFWQISWFLALKPVDRFHYERDHYLLYPETTTTRNENRPVTFTLDTLPQNNLRPFALSGDVEASVESWLGSKRSYQVSVKSDALIAEPTAYFRGWEVKVDGKKVPLDSAKEAGGLVSFRLTARDEPYKIQSGFTGRTLPRVIGELVTIATVVWLAYTMKKKVWQ